jgi:hypothetical protein
MRITSYSADSHQQKALRRPHTAGECGCCSAAFELMVRPPKGCSAMGTPPPAAPLSSQPERVWHG